MLANVHKDYQRYRLSPHFVYESYDEARKLFFNRGSHGFLLEATPLTGADLTAQGELAEFLRAEGNLPEGASLQILLVGTKNIHRHLEYWKSFRRGDVFERLAQSRVDFLLKVAEAGNLKDFRVFFAITVAAVAPTAEQVLDMERRRDNLKNTLKSINMVVWDVDAPALLSLLRDFFDFEEWLRPDWNPLDILGEQVLPGDFEVSVDKDGVHLLGPEGSERPNSDVVCLEAAKRPSFWQLQNMALFLGDEMRRGEGIDSDFIISLNVLVERGQGAQKIALSSKRAAIEKNMRSTLSKFMPNLGAELEDLSAAFAALSNGDKAVFLQQSVVLKDRPEKIKQNTHKYQAMMRRNGFGFVECKNDHLPVLLSCLPLQAVEARTGMLKEQYGGFCSDLRGVGRGRKTVSGEVQALSPIIGEWKGDSLSPGMLLCGRLGQTMFWSPFGEGLLPGSKASTNENFNICVAGVSGAGKSVFLQEIMLSTLGVGGTVFVLDYGKSFKRTCQILGGTYIEFDKKRPVSLNPFSMIPEGESDDDIEARADALGALVPILGTMACPIGKPSNLQNAMLQKALYEVWRDLKSKAEISDVADWLCARDEDYAKDLGVQLFPFSRDGLHGKFFSGPAKLSLKGRIVVIETEGLGNDLLSVVVQMMIVHINREMARGDRTVPKLIMIDEAHRLLKGGGGGDFVKEATRITRKYKGAICLATQQLNDYFRDEGGAAEVAFENSSWKLILKQNSETLVSMRANPKLLGFVKEDWQLRLLQSVHSAPPHYSEVAIFGPDIRGVIGRLRLDPFTLLLCSTNAADYQALEEKTQAGMSVADAVSAVLEERRKG